MSVSLQVSGESNALTEYHENRTWNYTGVAFVRNFERIKRDEEAKEEEKTKGKVHSRLSVCQVKPVDPAEVRKMTADLRNNPTSDLEKMFQQGDPKTVTEFITTVSAMLNSDSKTSQTGACRMLCCFLLTPRSRGKNKTKQNKKTQ